MGYCPRCGKDVFAEPAPAPEPEPAYVVPAQEPAAEVLAEPPVSRRRTAFVAIAAVAALALAGTVWAAFDHDSDDGFWAQQLTFPAGVTERPEKVWTWDDELPIRSVTVLGDTTYVVGDDGVHAIEVDGHEEWTSDGLGGAYVMTRLPASHAVLVAASDRGEVVALDGGTGKTRWRAEGDFLDLVGDHVVLTDSDAEEVRTVDARTGDQLWAADIDQVAAVGPGAVYVLRDDHVLRLDIDSGDETWGADLDSETAAGMGALVVADGFVAVQDDDAVQAFDDATGRPVWSADIDRSDASYGSVLGRASRTTVYVVGEEHGRATIRDAGGRVGSVESGQDGFFGFPVHAAAGDFLFDYHGTVYDDDQETVGVPHPRVIGLSSDGLYELRAGRIAFSGYAASEPSWTMAKPVDHLTQFGIGDHVLVAGDGSGISLYR